MIGYLKADIWNKWQSGTLTVSIFHSPLTHCLTRCINCFKCEKKNTDSWTHKRVGQVHTVRKTRWILCHSLDQQSTENKSSYYYTISIPTCCVGCQRAVFVLKQQHPKPLSLILSSLFVSLSVSSVCLDRGTTGLVFFWGLHSHNLPSYFDHFGPEGFNILQECFHCLPSAHNGL